MGRRGSPERPHLITGKSFDAERAGITLTSGTSFSAPQEK